ncbi:hypothetical protein A0H81_07921 [Grifola frondosa]|uniref:F-box domain-containing protein n=1 Tax=Grifola frondosa TaxID=5627 RepID=A0A1C7M5Q6_GRIFR|nr:hypothetical protein A0H81_07921 [Grifola frondosa]
MSCSLCRVPFTPSSRSVNPHPPPSGILTDKQYNYLQFCTAIGSTVPGLVTDLTWLDNNLFGGMLHYPIVLSVAWESEKQTIFALHTGCAAILRHQLNASDNSNNTVFELCQLAAVLIPRISPDPGRLPGVNYESVGDEKVDLRPFWGSEFKWRALKENGLEWILNRPDVYVSEFPRFHQSVSQVRLAAIGPAPESTNDIITTLSFDIVHILLPYLTNASFVLLLSTCRLLRRHALTTFQPHARERVLALGWAVPTPTEYASVMKKSGKPPAMAHAQDTPYDADWLLYLSQVHRTGSMRARRRVWALAKEIVDTYSEARERSGFGVALGGDGVTPKKTPKGLQLEREIQAMGMLRSILHVHNNMSCGLCCLPFSPSPDSTCPRPLTPETLTSKQKHYLQYCVAIGDTVPGLVTNLVFLGTWFILWTPRTKNLIHCASDGNLFRSTSKAILIAVTWESPNATIFALHTACATILRHMLGASDESFDSVVELCQVPLLLGSQTGVNAGRIPGMDYDNIGVEKVDLRRFWITGNDAGMNQFNWLAFEASGFGWALNRPDIFPKLHTSVSEARLAALGPAPESTSDMITTQPLDVLHVLLPYLSDASFVALLSTCRLLRHHALTTFQPHARRRVLALGWAVPTPTEYASVKEKNGGATMGMAHARDTPHDADWLLYLSRVHRSQSMRARRRVWALAEALAAQYKEKRDNSKYAEVPKAGGMAKSRARIALEKKLETMAAMRPYINGSGGGRPTPGMPAMPRMAMPRKK